MEAVKFYINKQEIPYRFIIESMDLSDQHNVAIHTMGDAYKVSSYGKRVVERNISGIIPSPGYDLISIIEFYDRISIRNNYGNPITLVSQNHVAHGQVVGMSISLEEGKPGGIVLRFLDMGSEVESHDDNGIEDDKLAEKKVFQPIDRSSADYLRFSFSNKYVYDEDMNLVNLFNLYSLTSAGIVFSSRYQVIDSRKSVIYYSENPVQIYGSGVITIEDSQQDKSDFIGIADRRRIGVKRREILDDLSVTEESDARVDIYSALDNGWVNSSVPIEILNIQATDIANQINYMNLSFNGIAYYDDFMYSYAMELDVPLASFDELTPTTDQSHPLG